MPEDLYLKLRRVPFAYRQYIATIKGKTSLTRETVLTHDSSGPTNSTLYPGPRKPTTGASIGSLPSSLPDSERPR